MANCQVAVTVALANQFASIPAAFRLYLPEDWAKDPDRREETGIPAEVVFKPKTAIALEMIGALRRARVPKAPILADAAYGDELVFRQELTTRGWWYVVAVRKDTGVWVARVRLDPNKKSMGSGRHAKEIVRRGQLQFMDAKTVAESLRDRAWHEITWRNGTKGLLRSRFAVLPARPGTWDSSTPQPKSFERLLIEWPKGEPEPTDYWLSTMPESKLLRDLVSLAKLRWRIEQDFLERVFPAGVREPIGLSPVGSWVTGVRPWGSKNLNLNRRIWIRCESA